MLIPYIFRILLIVFKNFEGEVAQLHLPIFGQFPFITHFFLQNVAGKQTNEVSQLQFCDF